MMVKIHLVKMGNMASTKTDPNEFMKEKELTVDHLNLELKEWVITPGPCYACHDFKLMSRSLCLSHGIDYYLAGKFSDILTKEGDEYARWGIRMGEKIANEIPCFYCFQQGDNCSHRYVPSEKGKNIHISYCRKCMINRIYEEKESI
jgi:hypothetical protein